MMPPPVALLVLNWNQREMTLECLASLARTSYPRLQTVLVDNGSTDGTAEAVRKAHPDVHVLETGANLLFAGGNNAGLRYILTGEAEYIVLLNNDTLVDPGFLEPLVACLQDNPRCGVVSPKIYYSLEPNRIWYAGGEISFWTGALRHVGIREIDGGQYDSPRETEYATGCCLLIRRTAVEQIGLLDESYRMYTEDADWSIRARRAGWTVWFEPRARIWHRLSASAGGHLSWYKLRNKARSNMRFFFRHASWYQLPVIAIAAPVANALAAVHYLTTARH